jgi:two-component system phosphate regulon sensor histidine kinase PhoR
MFPWLLVVLFALAAAALLLYARRLRAENDDLVVELSQAERSRETQRAEAQWYTSLWEALQRAQIDAALVVCSDRVVQSLNPGARELFGSLAESGRTLIEATRSVELDDLAAHCLKGGADCDRHVRLGHSSLPFRARAVRIGNPKVVGGRSGVVLVLQDLSEVQRLGRARRDFVANISHELRTPITSIRLLADTLRGTTPTDAATRDQLLEKISVETEALAQLSQELLDLAQIESGQALVRLLPTPAGEIVATVVERFAPQAQRKAQTVRSDVPPDLVAWADVAQVTRALGNLVHNAIKFTPAAGTIRVAASRSGADVLIEVSDTGPGIAPEDLPRVFERFFRADRSRAGDGTGLGLAIARHVIEAHGGRIWVESVGRPGQGATFRFTLPAVEPSGVGADE